MSPEPKQVFIGGFKVAKAKSVKAFKAWIEGHPPNVRKG